MFRTALQIPNFTYPGVDAKHLFDTVTEVARTAEASGFEAVMVMDHFYQLPTLGPPEAEMFESYTLLAGLAARTESAMLGTLVSGVTYRNPAHLAKIVSSLDVISRGRAFLGLGAAWFEGEHRALGYDFPAAPVRLEMLEEAVQICRAMFRGQRPTFDGSHFRTLDAINSPAPITDGGPPIMVGGSGEKVTLRIVAAYADMWNTTAGADETPRKIDALEAHCRRLGRDPAEIHRSFLTSVAVGETTAAAEAKRDAFLADRGMPYETLPDEAKAIVDSQVILGDRDTVAERIRERMDLGFNGVVVNMPADGWDLDAIRLTADVVKAATT